jgi:hypothetical protein
MTPDEHAIVAAEQAACEAAWAALAEGFEAQVKMVAAVAVRAYVAELHREHLAEKAVPVFSGWIRRLRWRS